MTEKRLKTEKSAKPLQAKAAKAPQKPLKPKKIESVKKKPSKGLGEVSKELWGGFRQYLREVAFELRKVVWPSRKETLGSTAVVIVVVFIAGIFLGITDIILSRLVRLVIG
jgi:preprotein translocase subunit SecE